MLQHLPVHHMPALFIVLVGHLIHYWGRRMNVTDDVRWDGSLTEQVSHSSSYTYTYIILCHIVICDSVYIASCAYAVTSYSGSIP